jgi:hypothetical protein
MHVRFFALILRTGSWGCTMYQCRKARKKGWGKSSLIWLLERDGSFFWVSTIGEYNDANVQNHIFGSISPNSA